jgi:hypothetical protein
MNRPAPTLKHRLPLLVATKIILLWDVSMRIKRYLALTWIRKEYEMTPVLTLVVVVLVIMIVVIMIAGYFAPLGLGFPR